MKTTLVSAVLVLGLSASLARAASPQEEVRSAFDRFVAAQNAHDLAAVEGLLLDSPDFLWITRGSAVWGRSEALKRFGALYQGTWKLEPEPGEPRVVFVDGRTAQVFAPITFTIGPAGQPAPQTKFLMNMVLRRAGDAWRVSSILPIPIPPPPPAPPAS